MKCPVTNTPLIVVERDKIELDYSPAVKGIWFDAGESDWLRHRDAAAAIDTGDPLTGREKNRINRYRCPRCAGGMLRRVDHGAHRLRPLRIAQKSFRVDPGMLQPLQRQVDPTLQRILAKRAPR